MKKIILLALGWFCILTSTSAFAEKKHKATLPPPAKSVPDSNAKFPAPGTGSVDPAERPLADRQPKPSPATALSGLMPENLKNCDQKHSIESFMQIASNYRPTPTKTGAVYFVSDLRDSAQLYFSKSPGAWPEQLTFFPDGLKFYALSPDETKVLVASDLGGDEQYDILLLDLKTKDLRPLLVDRTKRVESVSWGPDSQWFAYTSNARNKLDFDLYRYRIGAEPMSELLAELKGLNTITDVADNGRWISLNLYRSVTDAEVQLFDLQANKIVPYPFPPDTYTAGGQFSADSKFMLVVSDADKGVRQLYRAPVDDPAKRKPLTFGQWDVETVNLDPQRRFLTVAKNEDGYTQLEAFALDRGGQKTKPLPLPRFEKGLISGAVYAQAKGENALFYTRSASTVPADVWKFSKGINTKWTQGTHTFLAPQCMGKETLVRYPSFDGKEIPAFVYRPANTEGPIPFIVSIHGGPEVQTRPGFNKMYQYLLERGYGIFAPNVRGSTGYGREFTLADNYKKRMDSVRDALEGSKWLLTQKYAKPGELAVYGGSYGGFMVLRMLQLEPTLFAAASSSVGITDFVTFLTNTKPYRRPLREVEYGPLADAEFLKSISPMTYLKELRTPLLIFHGSNDPRVPVSETEQLVAALKKRDVPVEFKIFGDEGHGNTKLKNIMEQAKTMAYFFERHIQNRAVSSQP